jgi:hypothetical protein
MRDRSTPPHGSPAQAQLPVVPAARGPRQVGAAKARGWAKTRATSAQDPRVAGDVHGFRGAPHDTGGDQPARAMPRLPYPPRGDARRIGDRQRRGSMSGRSFRLRLGVSEGISERVQMVAIGSAWATTPTILTRIFIRFPDRR